MGGNGREAKCGQTQIPAEKLGEHDELPSAIHDDGDEVRCVWKAESNRPQPPPPTRVDPTARQVPRFAARAPSAAQRCDQRYGTLFLLFV